HRVLFSLLIKSGNVRRVVLSIIGYKYYLFLLEYLNGILTTKGLERYTLYISNHLVFSATFLYFSLESLPILFQEYFLDNSSAAFPFSSILSFSINND